jgi:hypothetical protein
MVVEQITGGVISREGRRWTVMDSFCDGDPTTWTLRARALDAARGARFFRGNRVGAVRTFTFFRTKSLEVSA